MDRRPQGRAAASKGAVGFGAHRFAEPAVNFTLPEGRLPGDDGVFRPITPSAGRVIGSPTPEGHSL
jgi:hypothetical protein